MTVKYREVLKRCCVRFPWLLWSQEAPEIARGASSRVRADIGGDEGGRKRGVDEFPQIPPQEGMAITISVIEGFSKGLAYQMSRSCITAGRIGGGADFEFDDPLASDVHCMVAARQDGVQIYDGASTTGIYVNDRRVSTAKLKHRSTFRIGSSLFQVSVLPSCQRVDIG